VAKHFHGIIKPYFKRRAKKDLELGLPPKIERTLYVPLSSMQLQLYKNYLRHGSIYGPAAHPYRNQMIPRKICLHPYLFPGVWPEEEEEFGEHCI
jgi:SNF2 family DNA or RNA helicase